MAATTEQTPAPAATPQIDVTINTKPSEAAEVKDAVPKPSEPTKGKDAVPKIERENTVDSVYHYDTEEDFPRVARPVRRAPRQYSVSPIRIHNRFTPHPVTPLISSSTQLLEQINYDGVADMPFPGRSSIYITTFPFTDRDVKKWAWLFANGTEEVFLSEVRVTGRGNPDCDSDDDEVEWMDDRRPVRNYNRRNRGFINDNGTVDVGSVYMSRALDTNVIAENTENVTYLIVVQNRSRPAGGAKLMTAESRKAAGVIMYYEALTGNSIGFVGAIVGGLGKKAKKFKKVQNVEEAVAAKAEGVLGVVC